MCFVLTSDIRGSLCGRYLLYSCLFYMRRKIFLIWRKFLLIPLKLRLEVFHITQGIFPCLYGKERLRISFRQLFLLEVHFYRDLREIALESLSFSYSGQRSPCMCMLLRVPCELGSLHIEGECLLSRWVFLILD